VNQLRDCPAVPFFTTDSSAVEPTAFPDDPGFDADADERLAAGSAAAKAKAQTNERLKKLREIQMVPPSVSAKVCQGCDVTLDFRCQGQRNRSSFMHRLTDCVIPRYGLLEKARRMRDAAGKKQTTCILTWFNDREASVEPLLKTLIYNMDVRFITEDVPCTKDMMYWTQQPHWNYGARPDYLNAWNGLTNVAGRVVMNPAVNMQTFLIDVQIASAFADVSSGHFPWPPAPKVVLVQRPRGVERAFGKETFALLHATLSRTASETFAGRKLRIHKENKVTPVATYASLKVYNGKETIKETLSMFSSAVLTVGFHGASLVNTLYAVMPSCVQEITTNRDISASGVWRSHGHLQHLNPWLVWQTHSLPLRTLLDANNVTKEEWSRAQTLNITNRFIQKLGNVQLLGVEASRLHQQYTDCLEKNVYLEKSA